MAAAASPPSATPVMSTWQVSPGAIAALSGERRNKYNAAARELANGIVELGAELKCRICLSLMQDPTQCPCGHVFCRGCAEAALSATKRCPLCRTKCTKRELAVSFVFQGIINTYRAVQPEGMDLGTQVRA